MLTSISFSFTFLTIFFGFFIVNGGFTEWSRWTRDKLGLYIRERNCTNPKPACGGQDCTGDTIELESHCQAGTSYINFCFEEKIVSCLKCFS